MTRSQFAGRMVGLQNAVRARGTRRRVVTLLTHVTHTHCVSAVFSCARLSVCSLDHLNVTSCLERLLHGRLGLEEEVEVYTITIPIIIMLLSERAAQYSQSAASSPWSGPVQPVLYWFT